MRAIQWLARPRAIGVWWWRVGLVLWVALGALVGLTFLIPSSGPAIGNALAGEWNVVNSRVASVVRAPTSNLPERAPDFTLGLYDGGSFQLGAQRGKVVVVNFWASWCVPCRDEAPRLETAYGHYHARGVAFVGINIQDTSENASSFLREFRVTYPNGLDEGMGITQAYRVTGLPTTLIVGRDGRIRQRWQGELQDGQLDGWIAAALR